tara:strand:- start:25 stop:1086 length:1062 start_codon:yes stop_codon:yes gene_type:complete
MAYTTIDDPSAHFQIALYAGNASTNVITNDGNSDLQPDWVWIKNRTTGGKDHVLYDSSRGVNKQFYTNNSNAEDSVSNGLTSFNTDGFTLGDNGGPNASGNHVAWQWKCNSGTSSASGSESGSNLAYDFQVNTTSKFMINKYTGRGSSSTLNLGNHFTPEFMIFKNRSQADDWVVYHHKNTAYPWTDHLHLNTTAATSDDEQMFEDVVFAADEINLGTNHEVNADGENYVAYAFASVQGYSKFGSYTGNGNADGPFVYTGFKPAWLMIKVFSGNTGGWDMYDNKRGSYNGQIAMLQANDNGAEQTADGVDFLSNGFKIRHTSGNQNGSGNTHIYMAFAEHPFVSSEGVPVTAR